MSLADTHIMIPVSAGELLDKLSILEIKKKRIQDEAKVALVKRELLLLETIAEQMYNRLTLEEDGEATQTIDQRTYTLGVLYRKLLYVNEQLWDLEEALRKMEHEHRFDEEFVEKARLVYKTNDHRFALKQQVNQLVGSELAEQKDLPEYKDMTDG